MAHMAAAHFEYPQRHPLSPPETNADSPGTTAMPTPLTQHVPLPSRSVGDPEELGAKLSESPTSRFRRVSTLAYHNSPLRDNRDRSSISRPSKPLIIVIPPQALLHECGQLGHTLSQGPPHRLSHGILMPLFPTMYGQLTAIAREFNFPSTSGLCIYYHFSDNGLTSTPRVSDESWQLIWSHVFDERSVVSSPRPPITGKIEFDIDTRQARWYSAWLGTSRRDPLERMSVTPSAIHSIDHTRIESKTTFQDDFEDMNETPQRPKGRHVPRKLSLVDRYESMSARSTPASGALLSPPVAAPSPHHLSPIPQADEPLTAKLDLEKKVTSWRNSASLRPSSLALKGQTSLEPANMPNTLPIDNPPSTEDDMNLEDFHWSVSSQGPPEYDDDTVSSVSRLPSVHLAHRAQGSVCLTPSVCTSFGPFDYDSAYSPISNVDRLPSPDIARRMLDDCPPTPSTATSWGAPLSYPPSPASEHSRLSLDIAHRAVFSRPITPATATSWGAPSWPASPVYSSRPPSVHMDRRGLASRPLSPVDLHESAPWPFVWPYNHHQGMAETSDADIIDEADEGVEVPLAQSTRLVWPYEQHGSLAALEVSSQDVPQDVDVLQAGVELVEDEEVVIQTSAPGAAPWNLVWPYTQQQKGVTTEEVREIVVEEHKGPWHHVWPYTRSHEEYDEEGDHFEEPLQSAASSHTWPYDNDAGDVPVISLHANAHVRLFNHPYSPPAEAFSERSHLASIRDAAYPYFLLYPAVYPHFDLYPTVSASRLALAPVRTSPAVLLGPSKPYPFCLYEIYPPIAVKPSRFPGGGSKPYPTNLYAIYPPVARVASGSHGVSKPYPTNLSDIYPPVAKAASRRAVVPKPYPMNLYEIYPDISLYFGSGQPYPTNLNHIYTPVSLGSKQSSHRQSKPYPMNLYEIYPTDDLYPGCHKPYPVNLEDIYASIPRSIRKEASSKSKASRPYPSNLHEIYSSLDLYPGYWRPYPANLDEVYRSLTHDVLPTSLPPISYSATYPSNLYQIYPSQDLYHGCWKAYPANLTEIYRPLTGLVLPPRKFQGAIVWSGPYPTNLSQIYPSNDLYPGIWKPYPANLADIYRASAGHVIVPTSQSSTSARGSAPYPTNLYQIYPSSNLYFGCWMPYPLNLGHIYRSFATATRPKSTIGIVGSSKPYPANLDDIYPAIPIAPPVGPKAYPFNLDEIYPPVIPSRSASRIAFAGKSKPYPFNLDEIYPSVVTASIRSTTPPVVNRLQSAALTVGRYEVRYPVFNLYPAVYPRFDLYPSFFMEVPIPGRAGTTSSLANVYPYFNLYRPIYPYLEIYPAAYEGKLQPLPPTRVPKFQVHTTLRHALRPPSVVIQPPTPQHSSEDFAASPTPSLPNPHGRHLQLTHSELHAIVMMESRSKSIFEDDDESPVSPPPQPRVVMREPPPVPSLRRPSPSRRSSISQAPPPLVSVSNVETTRQTSPYRNSVTALAQKYSSNTSSTSQSGSPLRRSVSAATPRSQVSPGLIRTRSIGLPSHPAAHKREMSPIEGPASPPSRLPKRRDSLVLQRVRAYSSQGEKECFLNMDTISEFPLPPRPPTFPGGGRPVR
ncbi:hypothetical protein PC9H_004910 [Pleurotus ostreatus]|uniref:Uncharacterized protein n=1 Tax=Pleurotus ostreatus TaxID=5322 RepID=A0A8H7DSG2_PLEOS|nr:uncharacterized protein PC9H_004910 [Pleurotus ostreatus]KAF7432966.1 hypothetical protein PC9H_004910 [Pleurotus ostreatus]